MHERRLSKKIHNFSCRDKIELSLKKDKIKVGSHNSYKNRLCTKWTLKTIMYFCPNRTFKPSEIVNFKQINDK